MIRVFLRLLGANVTCMTREEAASWILEREIRVIHKPIIMEVGDAG